MGSGTLHSVREKCSRCMGRNHFAKVCKKKVMRAHEVLSEEVLHEQTQHLGCPTYWPSLSLTYETQSSFVTGTAEVNNVGKFGVTVNLVLRDQEVSFQLDSGAACNVLRKGDLPNNSRVLPTNKVLKVYNGAVVVPLGIYKGTLTNNKTGMTLEQEFVLVESAGISVGARSLSEIEAYVGQLREHCSPA